MALPLQQGKAALNNNHNEEVNYLVCQEISRIVESRECGVGWGGVWWGGSQVVVVDEESGFAL